MVATIITKIKEYFLQHRDLMKYILKIIIAIIFLCAIYDKWNAIWFEVGKNIHQLLHG